MEKYEKERLKKIKLVLGILQFVEAEIITAMPSDLHVYIGLIIFLSVVQKETFEIMLMYIGIKLSDEYSVTF